MNPYENAVQKWDFALWACELYSTRTAEDRDISDGVVECINQFDHQDAEAYAQQPYDQDWEED